MSTFAKASFDAASYSSGRPTYPPKLFEYIFRYAKRQPEGCTARWERAADAGCGTGQATSHLRDIFTEVVCVDPSAGMLRKARDFLFNSKSSSPFSPLAASSPSLKNVATSFTFMQGSAEDLRTALPEDGSVDMLIAAQACHWFDWSKVWPETRRVLRPRGGVAAFWVYGELRLTSHPSLTPSITHFWQGTDRDSKTSIGAYFERPGRTILERLLTDVPAPADVLGSDAGDLGDFQRVYFTDDKTCIPSLNLTDAPQHIHPTLMRMSWRWIDVLSYLRTASALHSYHERFPSDLQAPDDQRFLEQDLADIAARLVGVTTGISDTLMHSGAGEVAPDEVRGGDVAVRFWKDLREGVKRDLELLEDKEGEGKKGGVGLFDKVTVEWPVSMLLVRRV